MITQEQLQACLPSNRNINDWYDIVVDYFDKYEINTPERQAAFLSQCGHESADFRLVEENLNYGAKGLRATFPRYFPTDALANSYQRQPEKIANHVYANRMGNGNEASGDGWKYHGRGVLQITGKNNYSKCSQDVFGDDRLVDQPELLIEHDGAMASACWYWNIHNCNAVADTEDTATLTRIINGGENGLDDRERRYNMCILVLR